MMDEVRVQEAADLEGPVRAIVGVVRYLVDHPEAVDVRVIVATHKVIAELRCAPGDVGQVIGRAGHLITSVRALLAALAGRAGVAIELTFVTEEEAFRARQKG